MSNLEHSDSPTALVTGVGRRRGIGAAICRAFIRDGWRVCASGWADYDRQASWTDPDLDGIDGLIRDLEPSGRFQWCSIDLEDPAGPGEHILERLREGERA
jgi:3-oxoacyl-[acyl-carrier protein] reductase